mgnify:CR=1 FL=1
MYNNILNEKKKIRRWWDDDGDNIGYESGEVSGRFKRKKKSVKEGFSNWRQDLSEVIGDVKKNDKSEDIKITEKEIKNKVKINPTLDEAVEQLGGTLLEITEIEDFEGVFDELSESDIFFLTDDLIEGVVEEVFIESIQEGYDIFEIENTLLESLDVSSALLNEAKVTYGHDTDIKSDRLEKVKSAVKKVGKGILRGAGYVAGAAVRGAKAVGREFGSGYKRGRYGSGGSSGSDSSPSPTYTRSDSNSDSTDSGSSKPGLLSRIGSALKRGLKKVVAKGARAVSRGARNVARKMEDKGKKSEILKDPWEGSATTPSKKSEPKPQATTTTIPAQRTKKERKRLLQDVLADATGITDQQRRSAQARRRKEQGVNEQYKLLEKAESKQQQKLFGLALSVSRGETPRSGVSAGVLKIVDTMSEKEIRKFAKTSHDGLPKKIQTKEEAIREALLDRMFEKIEEQQIDEARKKPLNLIDLDANAMTPKKPGVEAEIGIKKDGKTVRTISPQQFNTYKKEDGEEDDFTQFRSSKIFKKTLKGNKKVRNLHRGGESLGLTARGGMDNNREVVKHVRDSGFSKKHGVNFKGISFTGDVPGKNTDDKKMKVIKNIINSKKPKSIEFSDDHAKNLDAPEKFNREEGKDKTTNRGSSVPKIKTYLTRDDGRPVRYGSGGGGVRDSGNVNPPSSNKENQRRRKKARRGMGESYDDSGFR